ncbi:MAG: metallophosphoesterase [Anaerolineae bacterium]|nr:metallophosphoesterase [Anaerolineae bacterium]
MTKPLAQEMAINDEPPTDRNNLLHHALVGLHALTHIPGWAFGLFILAAALLVGGLWRSASPSLMIALLSSGAYLVCTVIDWAWLDALPKKKISFGPVKPSLSGLIAVRLCLSLLPLVGVPLGLQSGTGVAVGIGLHVAASAAIWYATRVEPFQLGITHLELQTVKLPPGQRVRLVQLSDLHVERITRREHDVIERVNELDADYILLTGDYLNFSYIGEPHAIADARQILGELQAQVGIYAVRGTHQVDPNALLPILFEGLPIHWLRNEHLTVSHNGHRITFAGASCTRKREIDLPAVNQALNGVSSDLFTVLLYHTPDLVVEAAEKGVDLYLAGHTHGGQIRLPLYGAMLTGTEIGKRYEMGRYDVNGMTMYVSRGIGMEGMAAPRARFLCPPEIVCIDVHGAKLV